MRRLPLLVFLVVAIGCTGTGCRALFLPPNRLSPEDDAVLSDAKTATLYSIDPSSLKQGKSGENFENYKVLGKIVLNEKQTTNAIHAFRSAIADWDGDIHACFNPRHGLLIESGGHRYDFLLCYQCRQLYIYRDGKWVQELYVKGSPEVLNAMLTAVKIPLAATPQE